MIPSVIACLTWIPPLLGLGALLPHRADPALRPGLAGLLGLAAAGVAAMWLNFWIPIGPWVSGALWVAGMAAFVWRRRWLLEATDRWDALWALALLVAASALMRQPQFQHDTGFYHLQVMGWISADGIFPGLANVHHRLGFNSIWPLVAAALEHPLLQGKSAFFLNQLPIVFGGSIALTAARWWVAGDRSFSTWLLGVAALPVASATIAVGGLYVDYTAGIVVYLAIGLWARAFERGAMSEAEAIPAAFLSMFAAILKLSAAMLLPVAAVALVLGRSTLSRRGALALAAAAASSVGAWIARGVLLSGCVAFPAPATCIPALPWTVPEDKVKTVAAGIRAWARDPASLYPRSWDWVAPWGARVLREYPELSVMACALALGAAGSVLARGRGSRGLAVALASALLGSAYWFLSVPEPRFALGFLYVLSLAPLGSVLGRWKATERRTPRAAVAGLVLVTAAALAVALHRVDRLGTQIRLGPWQAPALAWPTFPRVRTEARTTRGGVRISIPRSERCWDAPIPCTPESEFDPALRFDGFYTTRDATER